MTRFEGLHVIPRGPEFQGQRPAPTLRDPGLNAAIRQRFRKKLFDYPLHFMETARIEGFPCIRLQWIALCKTAGIVLLRSGRVDPDVFSLLLNGVETADEMKVIYQHCPALRPHWETIMSATRPLAVFEHHKLSRMKDPALATVLAAFADAYFAQFGTSGE